MRLVLDENMPGTLAEILRKSGHDVLAVKESMRGADDAAILVRAQKETRVLLTQDKDFGQLAFRHGLPAGCGIILFRLTGGDPDAEVRRMHDVLKSRRDWTGRFAVVMDDRIRMRPLPQASGD